MKRPLLAAIFCPLLVVAAPPKIEFPPVEFSIRVPELRPIPVASKRIGFRAPPRIYGSSMRLVRLTHGDMRIIPRPLRREPEMTSLLAESFRDAREIEIWEIERAARITASNREVWGDFAFGGAGITRVLKIADEPGMLHLFRSLAALTPPEQPHEVAYLRGADPALTREAAVEAVKFTPDYVITFRGPHPSRLQVQVRGAAPTVLLETPAEWLMTGGDAAELESLLQLIQSLPAMQPEPAPIQEWRN